MAMPTAAPNSRVVSLMADATPWRSSRSDDMIVDVAGAVHSPIPAPMTTVGTANCRYDESVSSINRHKKPAESTTSPEMSTRLRPHRGV